jgi:apolipoprotein N-acyltransferase
MDEQLDSVRGEVKGGDNRRPRTDRGVKHSDHHRRIVVSAAGSGGSSSNKPSLVTWAESFIFAGISALLLLMVNLFPQYWCVSFFALTPFIYRIIKATPGESLRLGFLFGLSFFAVSIIDSPLGYPIPPLLKLLCGTGLFALFGWSVGWARHRWGFNPAIVALLWVGLEIGLVRLGLVGGLLGEADLSQPFFGGLVTLFGFLGVSAIIVLLNSLLVLLILKTLSLKIPRGKIIQQEERRTDLFSASWFFTQKVYLVPEGRAPPIYDL